MVADGFHVTKQLPSPSRRGILLGIASAAAAGTQLSTLTEAVAAPKRSIAESPCPTPWQRHLMSRLSFGYCARTLTDMQVAGSWEGWLAQQLAPTSLQETAKALEIAKWFPDLAQVPEVKWSASNSRTKGGIGYANDLANLSMLRRIYSRRQVLETMVDFWSNHLHVRADHEFAWVHRASYDTLIRAHALGKFDDLLVAASLHPAMLLYLDNWTSKRGAPNENQGRELLELHTVGRAAGYTEQMVKDSATILSGWTVDAFNTWDRYYDAGRHTTGPVQVLGFTHANGSPDGSVVTEAYLRYLAHHPATALRIATKLARAFVSDTPTTTLVNHLAGVFRSSGTDITATLRALVAHPDFHSHQGNLVRNPIDDFVATCRVLEIEAHAPAGGESFSELAVSVAQTTPLYQWPRPDGQPSGGDTWTSPTRMLNSFRMHWALASGWPDMGAGYKSPTRWLPTQRVQLGEAVDHLCRLILGKPSTQRIRAAVATATESKTSSSITRDHPLRGPLFTRALVVLLDSPDHMTR